LLDCGLTYAEVGKLFHHGRRTLIRWSQTAKKHGPEALLEKRRSGRPSKLPPEVTAAVSKALGRKPFHSGVTAAEWDGPVLVSWIQERFGLKISLRSAQCLLNSVP